MFSEILIDINRQFIKKYIINIKIMQWFLILNNNLRYGGIFNEKQVQGISGVNTKFY